MRTHSFFEVCFTLKVNLLKFCQLYSNREPVFILKALYPRPLYFHYILMLTVLSLSQQLIEVIQTYAMLSQDVSRMAARPS